MGLQIQVLTASASGEIFAAFDTFVRVRPNALFIAPDPFFTARRVQLVHLAEEPRGDRRVDRRDRWFPARHLFKVWDRSASQRNGFAAARRTSF
jgi:hypothetical protein